MSQVVLDTTTSLDGFVTPPNDGLDRGLGDNGEVHTTHISYRVAKQSGPEGT